MPEFSFKKGERLSGATTISSLFQSGRSVISFPFRLIYAPAESVPYPARVAISVPKRLFKKAVDRNLLKRRIREAYRLNKQGFHAGLEAVNLRLDLVILYQHREITDYHTIQSGLVQGMHKIVEQVSRHSSRTSPDDGSAS